VNQFRTRRTRTTWVRRAQATAAILLVQVNLALAAVPVAAQQQSQAPAPTTQAVPDSPAPVTQGTSTAAGAATPATESTSAPATLAQEIKQDGQPLFAPPQPFHVPMPHSHNPIAPYRPSTAPELNLSNSPRLQALIRDGKIYVSLHDAIAVAIENNLDLAYFRYNFPIAQTDIQRTKAGSTASGVNTSIVQGTQGGFAASTGGGGGSSGGSAGAGNGGIVTSTLGAGTSVSSFDPYLTFTGYVDHTTVQEANEILTGRL